MSESLDQLNLSPIINRSEENGEPIYQNMEELTSVIVKNESMSDNDWWGEVTVNTNNWYEEWKDDEWKEEDTEWKEEDTEWKEEDDEWKEEDGRNECVIINVNDNIDSGCMERNLSFQEILAKLEGFKI